MPDTPAAPAAWAERGCIRRLPERPDLLALHAADPQRFFCLLRSSGALSSRTGRYDILFADPLWRRQCAADSAAALRLLQELQQAPGSAAAEAPLPFLGGHVFFCGYELAGVFEPKLRLPPAVLAPADLVVWRTPAAILHDHDSGESWCVAEDPEHCARLAREVGQGRRPAAVAAAEAPVRQLHAEDPARYRRGVRRVLDYLCAGDALQVNLSRQWRLRLHRGTSAAALHAALHARNPAPFSALLRVGEGSIISASPERLMRIQNRRIETRPIAGTRRRGRTPGEDAALRRELAGNLKERAEHVMLIDLERNDLGRVCRPGSVRVDELLQLEQYASVHHLVSNIRGELRPEIQPAEALAALFPGGTITGCPKVRVMEIIAELEGEGRGAYTGSIGYSSRHGVLDSNILIRSLYQEGDEAVFRAGAGIVADSDPRRELAETVAKARGVLAALDCDPREPA